MDKTIEQRLLEAAGVDAKHVAQGSVVVASVGTRAFLEFKGFAEISTSDLAEVFGS